MTSAESSVWCYTILLRSVAGVSPCEAAQTESHWRRMNLTRTVCRGSKTNFIPLGLAGTPGLSEPLVIPVQVIFHLFPFLDFTYITYQASEGIWPSTEKHCACDGSIEARMGSQGASPLGFSPENYNPSLITTNPFTLWLWIQCGLPPHTPATIFSITVVYCVPKTISQYLTLLFKLLFIK